MQEKKLLIPIAIIFTMALLVSNTVASKIIGIGSFVFTGGIIIFPISYIFGDVLTEVYGYKESRKVIWSGFVALALMSLFYFLVGLLPSASFWNGNDAYNTILGMTPRIVLASIVAYFVGEFSNSYVLSKMKIWTKGKKLWIRTISSTVVGEGIDSFIFGFIAFAGLFKISELLLIIVSGYIFKVLYEILATPITYFIISKVKKIEGIDTYDHNIKYNIFDLLEK
ncbi:TPA: transporter [Candidatus Magasanikbacteria bacterium]|nr:MAG: transporter [Candidatus Magasanikbacteria bacterium RIFOXYC12_FULL_32_21b]HAO51992.1 transporter [Candidatus Magasanikbacteria bacterium]